MPNCAFVGFLVFWPFPPAHSQLPPAVRCGVLFLPSPPPPHRFFTCAGTMPLPPHIQVRHECLTFAVLGATGNLAQNKLLPSLFNLYAAGRGALHPLRVSDWC
jgi:hypothetical protein